MMKDILFFLLIAFLLGCSNDTDTIEKSKTKLDVKVKKQLAKPEAKADVVKELKEVSHEINIPDSIEAKMADVEISDRIVDKSKNIKKSGVIKSKSKVNKKKVTTKKKSAKKKLTKKKKKVRKKKSRSKAIITFEEPEFNYGRIKPGDVVKHNFKFKNTGTTNLIISNAIASCGCTTPSFPFIPIEPGQDGYIGVIFDSTGKVGKQRPSITLTTNVGTKKIYLTGYVYDKLMGQ